MFSKKQFNILFNLIIVCIVFMFIKGMLFRPMTATDYWNYEKRFLTDAMKEIGSTLDSRFTQLENEVRQKLDSHWHEGLKRKVVYEENETEKKKRLY